MEEIKLFPWILNGILGIVFILTLVIVARKPKDLNEKGRKRSQTRI
ncbi:hypothetical protein [Peribacillus saganii]|nr:hypothetical protein [Peribacillus saganii]